MAYFQDKILRKNKTSIRNGVFTTTRTSGGVHSDKIVRKDKDMAKYPGQRIYKDVLQTGYDIRISQESLRVTLRDYIEKLRKGYMPKE